MKIVVSAPAVALALAMLHLYSGLAFLAGPPRSYSSGSYSLVMSWLSADMWGALFLVSAALTLLAPHLNRAGSAIAHALPVAVLLTFGVGLLLTEILQRNEGWGGPVLYAAPALFHPLLVRARYSQGTTP